MFVEPVALAHVPMHARVLPAVVDSVSERVFRRAAERDGTLTNHFRLMEQRQPALAAFVAYELSELDSQQLQAVAYRLCAFVFGAFEEAFGGRLGCIELADINRSLSRLVADSELRSTWVRGNSYSEDAIALGQPALISRLRAEVERCVAAAPALDWDALDRFYESLLAMVLVLTQAVAPLDERAATAMRHH